MQRNPEALLLPDAEPVFEAPWQAEAFALAITLSSAGWYTWAEWTAVFSRRLKAPERSASDGTIGYFDAWLEALEELVGTKGIADKTSLIARKSAWIAAYERTPHGKLVSLARNHDEAN
jgi:nitrile hydratase accessory protein